MTHEPDSAIPILAESGFLPRWVSNSPDTMAEQLQRQQLVSPCPKLSLELILLRLNSGYYRRKSAIENDVAEAYVNQVAFLVSDSASRRKSPVSIRRIAKYLSTIQDELAGVDLCSMETFPTEEEISLAKQILRIRELHSMSLLAINETSHFERLLGLIQSRPSPTTIAGPAMDLSRARAREKIETLLAAVAKDLVQKSNRAVTTKIVVRCGGEPVHSTRYFSTVARAEAIVHEISVSVKITRGGKVVTAKQDVTEFLGAQHSCDLNAKSSPPSLVLPRNLLKVKIVCDGATIATGNQSPLALVPGQLGEKGLTRVVETSIRCNRTEGDESNTLVRFLVGQPGRMDRCARCEAYHRSFYCCRVIRGHLNDDFDWTSVFGNGVNGVDDLLYALHPMNGMSEKNVTTPKTARVQGDEAIVNEESLHLPGGLSIPLASRQRQSPQQSSLNLHTNLERANAALVLSSRLMNEAKQYNDAPARLSQEFISISFPVDPTDGHYTYCVICGLSGDLLCCDGCANVVHQNCVNLAEVPDGDWFCDECVQYRNSTGDINGGCLHSSLPFGRIFFDESKADTLSEMLASISDARPYQRAAKAENQDEINDETNVEIQDSMKRRRGRPRKRQYEETVARHESDNDAERSPRKRRGRPRKSLSEGHLEVPAGDPSEEVESTRTCSSGRQRGKNDDKDLERGHDAHGVAGRVKLGRPRGTRSSNLLTSRLKSEGYKRSGNVDTEDDQQDFRRRHSSDTVRGCRRSSRQTKSRSDETFKSKQVDDTDEKVEYREKRRKWRRTDYTRDSALDKDAGFVASRKSKRVMRRNHKSADVLNDGSAIIEIEHC
jgi:hypothetical protein